MLLRFYEKLTGVLNSLISQDKMTTVGQKDFLTGHQGLGERTKAELGYNERMTFANSGPKNLALSGEEKATTEPNGGPMLRPSPCSGPIQADYDYDSPKLLLETSISTTLYAMSFL